MTIVSQNKGKILFPVRRSFLDYFMDFREKLLLCFGKRTIGSQQNNSLLKN